METITEEMLQTQLQNIGKQLVDIVNRLDRIERLLNVELCGGIPETMPLPVADNV